MRSGSSWRTTSLAIALSVGLCLAGCKRSEATTPASPAPKTQTATDADATMAAPTAHASDLHVSDQPGTRTVAIFVKNVSGQKELDGKVDSLESLVTAGASDGQLRIISRADAINKLASYASEGANAGDAALSGAMLDKVLSNNTSAMRLAQNMGAEYVFVVTMSTYGQDEKTVNAYGVKRTTTEHKLSLSYTILDCFIGASLAGDTIESSETVIADANRVERSDVLNKLIKDGAKKLVASLKSKTIPIVSGDLPKAQVAIVCGAADLVVPGIFVDDKGQYQVSDSKYRLEAMNVTVTVDGVDVGSAPGNFEMAPGMHKLRLHRDGFKDYEGTFSATKRQNLKVDMQMTDEGLARWRSQTAFLEGVKAGVKMTDATVKGIEGFAQMLRQSGFKVDIKSDLKGLVQTSIFK